MNDRPDPPLALAAEFPAATEADWLALVAKTLKGEDFSARLVTRSHDGAALHPLPPRRPNARPLATRRDGAAWRILQRIDLPETAAARTEALHDLENGATGLALVAADAPGAYGCGLDLSEDALPRLLDGIYLDAGITLALQPGRGGDDIARKLAALVAARGIEPNATDIRFGLDPIGQAVHDGSDAPWPDLAAALAATAAYLHRQGFGRCIVAADGRAVHHAGGSEAQELAFVLGCALAYLRALEQGGLAPDAARRMIEFRLTADADEFLTIAKLRALRLLWARVEHACGLAPEPVHLTAETAWRMMARRDPHTNILRAAIAVAAAALGGADAIIALPFTLAHGLPDRFARRIARNTQLILLEEAHLARVTDPAAGAGGIEALTEQLCAAAWGRFQAIERAGGIHAALMDGFVQGEVAAVRAARLADVARGTAPLVGVTFAPVEDEATPAVLAQPRPAAAPAGAMPPLRPMRLAQAHENGAAAAGIGSAA